MLLVYLALRSPNYVVNITIHDIVNRSVICHTLLHDDFDFPLISYKNYIYIIKNIFISPIFALRTSVLLNVAETAKKMKNV